MIGRETRVLLRHYLEQSMSKAVIARQVGINPRTVYSWIAAGQLDRELDDGGSQGMDRGVRGPRSFDPYRGIIEHPFGRVSGAQQPFAFILHHHDCAEPDDEAGACVERGRRLPRRRLLPHGALSSVGRERLPYNRPRGDVIRGKKSSKSN